AHQAVGGLAIFTLDHLAHQDVLDRVMVGPEAELAAYRIEVGLAQRFTEGVLVARVGFFQGAENQQGGIVTLCGIEGRRTTVRLAETVDKGVVRDRKSTRLNSSHVSNSYAVFF